jgi:hypothetical protein
MKPTTLTKLHNFRQCFRDLEQRMGGDRAKSHPLFDNPDVPSSFEDALDTCVHALKVLADEFENVVECQTHTSRHAKQDEAVLRKLNESLRSIGQFSVDVSHELLPVLNAKLEDQQDPMVDYEIDARLAFVLREDDSQYSEVDDNFLTERKFPLKGGAPLLTDFTTDHCDMRHSSVPIWPSEPHCYLYHDLYDHSYGLTSPRLPLSECSRLGRVYIDIIVQQQYMFDLATGTLVKNWGDE